MVEVTHHSGSKVYLNPEYIVTIRRTDSGDTEILLMAGPPLAVKDTMADVLAALGHKPDRKKLDFKEAAE